MKKLLLILTFFAAFIFSPSVFAESCKIQSWPSENLSKYFNDVKSILWEIQKNISESKCEWAKTTETNTWFFSNTKENVSDWYNQIIKDSNKLTNFDNFLSSWELDIYPIFNWGLPNAFYRDHDYIVKQNDLINKMTIAAANKCATDKIIDSELIKKKFEYYWISAQTKAWDILSSLRTFNIKLSSYFRCTIAWSMSECKLEWSDVLASDIKSSYWDSKNECNQNETGFKKIMEKISAVFDSTYWFAWIREWIEDWRQSIALLTWWSDTKVYRDLEKSLLTKELSRQWLNTSQAQRVLDNLACMNNADSTIISCIWENIKSFWSSFEELIGEIQKWDIFNAKNPNEAPINVNNTKDYGSIIEDIKSNYEGLEKIMKMQNSTSDKSLTSLINLHSNLIDANKILESKIAAARALCNRQATWIGNCGASK